MRSLAELVGAQIVVPSTSGDVDLAGLVLSFGYAGYLRVTPPLNTDYRIDEIPTPNDNEIVYVHAKVYGFPAVDILVRYPEANAYHSVGNSQLQAGGGFNIWIRGSIKPVVRAVAYVEPVPPYYLELRMWKLIVSKRSIDKLDKSIETIVVTYPNVDVAAQAASKLIDMGFKRIRLLELEG